MSVDRCVMCGEYVPEGRMICHKCEDIKHSFDTTKIYALADKVADITKFVALVLKYTDDVVVAFQNYRVNSKR